MTDFNELLASSELPSELILSEDDALTLFKMHKGLLKENERNKAFWRSTNENLALATSELDNTNQELRRLRDQLWGEMQLAKKIQTVLLPERTDIDGYQVTAHMKPADEVGGDYYDIINTESGDWIAIGDVSGHGVSAGLVMMMAQTSIRVALSQHEDISPSRLLSVVNRVIYDNIRKLNDNQYMTMMVMAVLENGSFVYSGLHQDLFVYRCQSDTVERIESKGTWLGLVPDIGKLIEDYRFSLDVGDVTLLYTDGITEAAAKQTAMPRRKSSSTMFGEDRLMAILKETGPRPTTEIRDGIIAGLSDYDCDDDISMVVVKRVE